MARYPNNLCFDGDACVRGSGGVARYILRREETSSICKSSLKSQEAIPKTFSACSFKSLFCRIETMVNASCHVQASEEQ